MQPPTIHREVDYNTALQRVVNTWKTCCDIAADNGQYVTWEFEPGFAFNKPSDIVRIHDAVDKRNFGLHVRHLPWADGRRDRRSAGRREGNIRETRSNSSACSAGRINHIHLIDSDNTCHKDDNGEDETSAHPPFGLGLLELRRDHARTC